MKQSERIGLLMFRYMRNDLSLEENTELLAWRNQSPKHETAFQEATDWESIRADFQALEKDKAAMWKIIEESIRKPEPVTKEEVKKVIPLFYRITRAAAVWIFILFLVNYRFADYAKNHVLY